jgi:hypothetical protein
MFWRTRHTGNPYICGNCGDRKMPRGKIRIKTLVKLLCLYSLAIDRNRLLTIDEIIQEIQCCRSNAYNYRKALEILFPPTPFDPNRLVVRDAQLCLRI